MVTPVRDSFVKIVFEAYLGYLIGHTQDRFIVIVKNDGRHLVVSSTPTLNGRQPIPVERTCLLVGVTRWNFELQRALITGHHGINQ